MPPRALPAAMALPPAVALRAVSWRLDEAVTLTLEDGADVALVCRCGRHHWAVTDGHTPGGPSLELSCHGCGSRRSVAVAPNPRTRG